MGYPTPIEWTDATWNPIGGCSIESPGCGPCYAQQLAGTRLVNHPLYAGTTSIQKGRPIFNGHLTAAPDEHPVWTWPYRWRGAKQPKLGAGMPSLIFVGDMSDLYHEQREQKFQHRVVGTIALAPRRHIGQLLTKRPHVMVDHIIGERLDNPHSTLGDLRECLWCGTSAERQKEFDERWYHLRKLAARGFLVFVSYEPALGPLTLPADFLALGDRAWLIAGGVSGEHADTGPDPDWFRAVRDQCGAAGVPFFFKQWGEFAPAKFIEIGDGGEIWRQTPDGRRFWFWDEIGVKTPPAVRYHRVGKKKAGHLLDGVEHRAFPPIAGVAIGAAA